MRKNVWDFKAVTRSSYKWNMITSNSKITQKYRFIFGARLASSVLAFRKTIKTAIKVRILNNCYHYIFIFIYIYNGCNIECRGP